MFSGRQTHRGKSQSPVAWVALVEKTKLMKPTDKAILGMVSESPGRNESEPTGGLENLKPRLQYRDLVQRVMIISGDGASQRSPRDRVLTKMRDINR